MGVFSKMLSVVGYTGRAAVRASVVIAHVLHLPAILPLKLRGANQLEGDDAESIVLTDGDEYIKSVVIETLEMESPRTVQEYIETVKLETVSPKNKKRLSEYEPVEEPTGLMNGHSAPSDSSSSSRPSDESVQPEEEIVEVSDEEGLPMPDNDKEDIPYAINVAAPPATRQEASQSSRAAIVSSLKENRSWVTTYKDTAYVPTGDGSMVAAPELADDSMAWDASSLQAAPKGRKMFDGISDSMSVESNATEATEDDRLRGIAVDLEESEREAIKDSAETEEERETPPDLGDLDADSKNPAVLTKERSTSSMSSMISSSSEDDQAAIHRELHIAPSFLPPIAASASHSVAL